MANQYSDEGSSTSNVSAESSESTVQLNIKTLDSQIYSFPVDKNMPVSVFKEKIANEIGLPVSQQRLIFRGKVLKDDHLLSEYHVENGHTLHLVERQPVQLQPSGASSSETTSNNGNDAGPGAPRNRVGQISHSVVLGTFNVGEQGEGAVPDLNRVIGAVLNSFGIGSQTTANVTTAAQPSPPNLPGQAPQGNEAEAMHVGSQNQAGNQARQAFPSQPFQSLPQVVQIPLAAGAIPVPSLHVPIPDSLNTLSEFMNRMEQTLSQNGYQPNLSATNAGELPRLELPSNAQGLPTPEALSIVLRNAERLLSGHAVSALSHIAGRLEQEGASSDSSVRSQIQTESMQIGLAMQHLGALLLELGRTILTLRMGRSPAESAMNSGPAVYISPSGPNPIMVQTSSLFGGSVPPLNSATFGPVGVGSAPRHVNIHIHAGPSLAPIVSRTSNGEGANAEHRNGTGSADLSSTRVLPVRNVIAAAVPHSTGINLSQPPPDSVSLSSVISEVNSQIRNFVGNVQGDTVVPSGQVESTSLNSSVGPESQIAEGNQLLNTTDNRAGDSSVSLVRCMSENGGQKAQAEPEQTSNNKETGVSSLKNASSSSTEGSLGCSSGGTTAKSVDIPENAPSSNVKNNLTEGAKAPLGLGLGGLERKRHSKQQNSLAKGTSSGTTSSPVNQNQQARRGGQHILQALASRGSAASQMNSSEPSPGQFPSADGQIELGSVMSQVLQSPALNGLLAGVSEQTGVGSPDVLRNMLTQFTQSPQIRNTVNQIAQQVGSQDLGNMFSGMERGQGGGMDLSSMFQQMMPIVSRALSSSTTSSQPFPTIDSELQSHSRDSILNRDCKPIDQTSQINLQSVAQRIEHLNPPRDVFSSVVENAFQLSGVGSASDDLVDELCSDEDLASEYMEMLRRDVHKRINGDSQPDKC
ncbi:Large proline-rich protein BAG6 [Quillaja saponaria]|uniref:Large proline-rich protein BAG6 n=1 Tax=Quillaja saponaria TaxID=32244 RepID=A0AAD7PJK1_QUISA|nr:Large proline-rich protein BAG6 [Quillaja saponaria]